LTGFAAGCCANATGAAASAAKLRRVNFINVYIICTARNRVAHALLRAASALMPTPAPSQTRRREESRHGTQECFPARRPGNDGDEYKGLVLYIRGCVRHNFACNKLAGRGRRLA
jgi:hypothetical protein